MTLVQTVACFSPSIKARRFDVSFTWHTRAMFPLTGTIWSSLKSRALLLTVMNMRPFKDSTFLTL